MAKNKTNLHAFDIVSGYNYLCSGKIYHQRGFDPKHLPTSWGLTTGRRLCWQLVGCNAVYRYVHIFINTATEARSKVIKQNKTLCWKDIKAKNSTALTLCV